MRKNQQLLETHYFLFERGREGREEGKERGVSLSSSGLLPESSQQLGLSQVSHMGGRHPTTLAITCYLPGYTLVGSWKQEQSWNVNSGIWIWDAGILRDILTTILNAHGPRNNLKKQTTLRTLCQNEYKYDDTNIFPAGVNEIDSSICKLKKEAGGEGGWALWYNKLSYCQGHLHGTQKLLGSNPASASIQLAPDVHGSQQMIAQVPGFCHVGDLDDGVPVCGYCGHLGSNPADRALSLLPPVSLFLFLLINETFLKEKEK